MRKFTKLVCISLAAFALPMCALALELVAPAQDCTLDSAKVRVIGTAKEGPKGKVEVGGKSFPFDVKDGSFFVVVDLPATGGDAKITVGDKSVTAKWKVDAAAKSGAFVYHKGFKEEKCTPCHAKGKLDADSDVGKTCLGCHKAVDQGKFLHGPLAMGMCGACHNSHGSKFGKLLKYEAKELCAECHNQPITETHSKKAGPNVLCTSCHNPHSSDKQFMVK